MSRKVDVRLPGKENSNFHGARPVYYNPFDDSVDSHQDVVNKELSLSLCRVSRNQSCPEEPGLYVVRKLFEYAEEACGCAQESAECVQEAVQECPGSLMAC